MSSKFIWTFDDIFINTDHIIKIRIIDRIDGKCEAVADLTNGETISIRYFAADFILDRSDVFFESLSVVDIDKMDII